MSALAYTLRQGSRLIWPDKPCRAGSHRSACDPAAAMRRDNSTHSRAGPTCKSLAATKNNTVFAGAGLRRRGCVRMANRPFGSIRSMLSTTSTPSGPSAGIVTVVRYWGTARWVRVGTFPSIHSMIESTAVKGIGNGIPRPGAFRQTAGNDRIDSLGRRQGGDALVGLGWSSHQKYVVDAISADWIGTHPQRGEFCGGVVAQPPADD